MPDMYGNETEEEYRQRMMGGGPTSNYTDLGQPQVPPGEYTEGIPDEITDLGQPQGPREPPPWKETPEQERQRKAWLAKQMEPNFNPLKPLTQPFTTPLEGFGEEAPTKQERQATQGVPESLRPPSEEGPIKPRSPQTASTQSVNPFAPIYGAMNRNEKLLGKREEDFERLQKAQKGIDLYKADIMKEEIAGERQAFAEYSSGLLKEKMFQTEQEQNYKNAQEKTEREIRDLDLDIKNYVRDPNRIFKKRKEIIDPETGRKKTVYEDSISGTLMKGLIVALGGLGRRPGEKNVGLDIINQQIDRDIDLQEKEYSQLKEFGAEKRSEYNRLMMKWGDAKQARLVRKAELAEEYSLAAKKLSLTLADDKAQAALMEQSQGLDQMAFNIKSQLTDARMNHNLQQANLSTQVKIAEYNAQVEQQKQKQAQAETQVPGVNFSQPPSKDTVKKVQEMMSDYNPIESSAMDLSNLVGDTKFSMDPGYVDAVKQSVANLELAAIQAKGKDANLTPQEKELILGPLSTDPSFFQKNPAKALVWRKNFEYGIQLYRNRINAKLKPYGAAVNPYQAVYQGNLVQSSTYQDQ